MPNLELRIVQSKETITVTADAVPVIVQENFGNESAAGIIANFLRGGSPAVQYLFNPNYSIDIQRIGDLLDALSLGGERFLCEINPNGTVAKFVRRTPTRT